MPKKLRPRISIAIAAALCAASQISAQTFDVASIRPAELPGANGGTSRTLTRFGAKGGPGTEDPGLYTCSLCNFSTLLIEAYDLKRYQVIMPDWMVTTRFDISAKVPAGTTREQFRVMMQNLLAERFKLTSHRDKKEMDVYALVIMKGGHKLKESAGPPAETPPPADPQAKPALDKDGFVITSRPMPKGGFMISGDKARIRGINETTKDLAERLSATLPKPVVDATGLTGRYDYALTFASGNAMIAARGAAPAGDPNTPLGASEPVTPIEAEVQSQLGLKLDSRKAPVEVLVVDHAEKTPTEN